MVPWKEGALGKAERRSKMADIRLAVGIVTQVLWKARCVDFTVCVFIKRNQTQSSGAIWGHEGAVSAEVGKIRRSDYFIKTPHHLWFI